MNTPTQEEIARKAYALWEQRGRPTGADTEIWLEAESLLEADSISNETSPEVGPAASVPSHAIAPTPVERATIVAEVQKQTARAPQVPQHTGPKVKPPESGKPVWKQAHSA